MCVLALFCFVHFVWTPDNNRVGLWGEDVWWSLIGWIWVACCLMHLLVSCYKYAIHSWNKMWLLSFRKITVKSYSPQTLNMSGEKETERERFRGTERTGRGQCFLCLFSKFEEAGESFVMRKTTTGWWFFAVFTREKIGAAGFWI